MSAKIDRAMRAKTRLTLQLFRGEGPYITATDLIQAEQNGFSILIGGPGTIPSQTSG